jgi:hypothetical protein
MRILLTLLLLVTAPCAALAAGIALLVDTTQLTEALKSGQPCCVIDARSEGPRKQNAIPFSVPFRDGMMIAATTYALVIADNDQRALDVARGLAVLNKGRIFALKGGFAAWQETLGGGAGGTAMPKGFVIPSNTCEQGKALHEFK